MDESTVYQNHETRSAGFLTLADGFYPSALLPYFRILKFKSQMVSSGVGRLGELRGHLHGLCPVHFTEQRTVQNPEEIEETKPREMFPERGEAGALPPSPNAGFTFGEGWASLAVHSARERPTALWCIILIDDIMGITI